MKTVALLYVLVSLAHLAGTMYEICKVWGFKSEGKKIALLYFQFNLLQTSIYLFYSIRSYSDFHFVCIHLQLFGYNIPLYPNDDWDIAFKAVEITICEWWYNILFDIIF